MEDIIASPERQNIFSSEKPAIVNCPYTGTGLALATETDAVTALTPDGCDPAKNYEQLIFEECSHTEPDKTNQFHLAVSHKETWVQH